MVGATRFELATPCTPCRILSLEIQYLGSARHRRATGIALHAHQNARFLFLRGLNAFDEMPVDVKRGLYVFMTHQGLNAFQVYSVVDEHRGIEMPEIVWAVFWPF